MKRAAQVIWLGALNGACAVLFAACTPSSFKPQFQTSLAPTPEALVRPMLTPPARTERAVAVGVTEDPMRLCAWDLDAGMLWERAVQAKSAPLVVGDAIVMQEAQGVVVRALANGEVRAVVDETGHLVGADGQGDTIVVSVAYDTASPRGAIALVKGDSVRWKQPLNLPVGVPAISGNHVLVPWATQRLSVLAAGDGKELARFHFKSTVIGHAIVERGHVYVGQVGLLPLTMELLAHPEEKTAPYTPKKRELPGQPALLRDGYLAVPEPDSAHHRLELAWHIQAAANGPATENDTLWLRFYRVLFALDAQQDALRWVRSFDHDLVGFASVPGGALVAESSGTLRFVDAQGVEQSARELGRNLRVLALRPGEQWVSKPAATPGKPLGELRAQLYAAATLDDDRLSAARAYAVDKLAPFDASEVTAQLIALCANRKSPEPVQIAACSRLSDRDIGGNDVIQTLRQHASFLEDTIGPPVGPLAQSAAKMQLKQAGPLLVSHLEDPNTATRDLVTLFAALEALGQRSAAPAIERFVRLHHAEPQGSELRAALVAAMHALGALKARPQRDTLQAVATDAFSSEPVREAAHAALAALDAVPKPVATAAPVKEEAEDDEVQTDPRPYSITAQAVRGALLPINRELSRCLVIDPSHPRSGRMSMVVDAKGTVEGIFVVPATLTPCIEPILRRAKFPPTRLGRQRVSAVVYGPNAATTAKPPRANAKNANANAKKK